MYQNERTEKILDLIRSNGYITVKYLVENLHYSKATINRDLNILAQSGKIKRTYGGAEMIENRIIPFEFRYHKDKNAKKRIAAKACELVEDGDTIFIDGSTTAQYMSEGLVTKKNLKILTNNMAIAIFLSEYGIEVILLGGKIVEAPYILSGSDTCDTISKYRADKCFFSTRDLTHDGEIEYDDETYFTMHKAMIKNSVQTIYLVNSEKIDRSGGRVILGDLSLTDTVISDYEFSDKLKNKFLSVSFIKVE